MQRNAQLWRFTSWNGEPLSEKFPARGLHRLIEEAQKNGVDLAHNDGEYDSFLEAVPGADPHLILHRLRFSDLPSQYQGSRVVPLDSTILGLAEGTHIRLLPRNLIIFITNGFSPRPRRFDQWLRARIGLDVHMQPVLRRDLHEVLSHLRRVSEVTLTIPSDQARQLPRTDLEDSGDALRVLDAAVQASGGMSVSIRMSADRHDLAEQGRLRALFEQLQNLPLQRLGVSRAKAKVYTQGRREPVPVNFIEDQMVASVEVEAAGGRGRQFEPVSATAALADAWSHFRRVERVEEMIDPVEGPALRLPDRLNPKDATERLTVADADPN